jgi:hypothetical protein
MGKPITHQLLVEANIDGYRDQVAEKAPHLVGHYVFRVVEVNVWEIPTQPLKVPEELGADHFAAFPLEWPRRIITGWSPSGICTACGEGRRPVVDVTHHTYRASGSTGRPKRQALTGNHSRGMNGSGYPQTRTSAAIAGYSCGCPEPSAPTTPALVLDPFGGTGTTALVARVLGRRGISVDMSSDYCRIAQWRTNDPAELARAAAAEKPPTVMRGQLALFGEEEAS